MIFLLIYLSLHLHSTAIAQSETTGLSVPTSEFTDHETLLPSSANNASSAPSPSTGTLLPGTGTGTFLQGKGTGPQTSGTGNNNTSSVLWPNSTLSSISWTGPVTGSIPSNTSSPAVNSTSKVTSSSSSSSLDATNSTSTPGVTWLSSDTGETAQTSISITPPSWSANNSTTNANLTFTVSSITLQSTSTASDGSLIIIPVPSPVTIPVPLTVPTSTFHWIEATDPPNPTTDPSLLTGITSWDEFEVTRTETVTPSSMSVDTITNSEWKKNFWLSTTGSDGKPTEVPVIHCGCICKGNCESDDVDGLFVWVIFWHVPRLPNVQFSFPKLPDFHFPKCIKIFGIKLGKCPPKSDNGRKKNKNKDPDDPKNRNREPDDPEDGDDKCETKSVVTDKTFSTICPKSTAPPPDCSTTSTTFERTGCNIQPTTTSTSTVSCKTELVTDTITQTICPTEGANAKDCTTTSSTSIRSGCDITASNTATFTATCSHGPVTDLEIKTLCPTSGAVSSQCSTITSSVVRTGHCLTATVSSTYSASSVAGCKVRSRRSTSTAEDTTEPHESTSIVADATTTTSGTTVNTFVTTSDISVTASNMSVTATLTTLLTLISTSINGTNTFAGNTTSLEFSSMASDVPISASGNDTDTGAGSTASPLETSSIASDASTSASSSSTGTSAASTASPLESSSMASDASSSSSSDGTDTGAASTASLSELSSMASDASTSASSSSTDTGAASTASPLESSSMASDASTSASSSSIDTDVAITASPLDTSSIASDAPTSGSEGSSTVPVSTSTEQPAQSSSESPAPSSVPPQSSVSPLPPPPPPPRDPDECYHRRWGAPKMEADKDSIPAFHRITKFCTDNHGATVEKDAPKDIYIREDVSGLGIPKRQSYWIRANAGPFDQCQTGTIDKQDCIAVLYNAINKCDSGDFTYGARAQGDGCVQYTFDISDVITDGEPPWGELKVHYPGIERQELHPNAKEDPTPWTPCPNNADCQLNNVACRGEGPGFTLEDADKAIEDFCQQKGEHDVKRQSKVNNFGVRSFFKPDIYLDERWCMTDIDENGQGKLVENKIDLFDCKYALTKIVNSCSDSTEYGRWYYRCVGYIFTSRADDPPTVVIPIIGPG